MVVKMVSNGRFSVHVKRKKLRRNSTISAAESTLTVDQEILAKIGQSSE